MSSSARHPWDANDPYPGDEEDSDCALHCPAPEADLMTGMATCPYCGRRWALTAAELENICRQVMGVPKE
jgi:hypothetical protein